MLGLGGRRVVPGPRLNRLSMCMITCLVGIILIEYIAKKGFVARAGKFKLKTNNWRQIEE